MFGAYSLSFWYGGILIKEGELNLQSVMQVFFAVTMMANSIGTVTQLSPNINKAKKAAVCFV